MAYFFGRRQAEQQRIIEERARVISDLFKRLWLTRPTARYVDRLIEKYRASFQPFEEEQGYAGAERWLEAWQNFERNSPELRTALEEESRAALGDTRARLSGLARAKALEPPPDTSRGS